MMEDWVECNLIDICELNPKHLDKQNLDDSFEVQFLPMKLVEKESNVIHTSEIRKFDDVKKKSYKYFEENDILFAKVTPCMENGKIAIARNLKNKIGYGSSEFHVFRCSSIISNKLMFFFLVQEGFRRNAQHAMTGAVGLRRVPKKYLEDHLFLVPPLPIQRAIVSKIESLFSSLDSGIADLKKAQEQLKIYRQAVLKKAFEGELTKEWREQQTDLVTSKKLIEEIKNRREKNYNDHILEWENQLSLWKKNGKEGEKPIKPKKPTNLDSKITNLDVVASSLKVSDFWDIQPLAFISDNKPNCIVDGPFGSSINVAEDYKETGVPVIRMVNIRPLKYVSKNLKFIVKEKFHELKRHNIISKDILIAKVGATIGDCCIYPDTQPEGMLSTTGSCRVRLDPIVYLPKLLQYYVFFQKYKLKSIASQTAQPFLNMKVLKAYPVPILTIREQEQLLHEIEYRLTVFDKVEESIKDSLLKANALRQSILKKAFEGKLLTKEEIEKCKQEADYEPASVLLERIKKEKKKS